MLENSSDKHTDFLLIQGSSDDGVLKKRMIIKCEKLLSGFNAEYNKQEFFAQAQKTKLLHAPARL